MIGKIEVMMVLDYVGTFVFGVSGIRLAARKGLDVFGLLVIGFITAVGGGTLRDVLIGAQPIFWMVELRYIILVTLSLVFTIILRHKIVVFNRTFFWFDTLGIGMFTIIGLEKTLEAGYSPMIAVMMGVVSSVAGGITRDILLNEIPLILRKEIYATACLVGALLYLGLDYLSMDKDINQIICFSVIVLIRFLAIKFNISFPPIKKIG